MKQSVPVIKSCLETAISGKWLKNEIEKSIFNFKSCDFKVRAVISDDHSSNISSLDYLLKTSNKNKKFFMHHPACQGSIKAFIKIIENNLLFRRKFVFKFDQFEDVIEVSEGYILWNIFYENHEKDIGANLKKARKPIYTTAHPGTRNKTSHCV